MSKVIVITDQHFGCRNDSQLFLDYYEKFYKDIFFPYIDEHKIDVIFNLGDLLDRRKYISFVTLKRMKEIFLDPMKDRNIHMYHILGNHDITYKNTNTVNAGDQLLYGYDNIEVYSTPTQILFEDTKVLLVPWIPSDHEEEYVELINQSDAKYVFGHLELNNFEVLRGVKMDHGMDPKIFSKFDAVLTGHFHHKQHSKNIYYLGCPYEITFSDLGDSKGFHVFDFDTGELEFVLNPYNMFHKILYDDKKKKYDDVVGNFNAKKYENSYVKVVVVNKSNPYFFEKFLDKLYASNPADVKVVDDFNVTSDDSDNLQDSDIISMSEDTVTVLNSYIDALDLDVNVDELKNIMREIYVEAQSVEF